MRINEDSPRRFLQRKLYASLFDGHPYGRPVIGQPEIIRGLGRDTLTGFYRRHYVPESFTLVVVGAVDPDEVLATTRRTFGTLPRSGLERFPPAPPAAPRPRRDEFARPGAHAYLGLAWLGPRLNHAETPAVDLLISIFGQSRSSQLTQALRERLSAVNSVGASFSSLEAAGIITVTALTSADVLAVAQRYLTRPTIVALRPPPR